MIWRKTSIIFELSTLKLGGLGVLDISSGQFSQKEHFQPLEKCAVLKFDKQHHPAPCCRSQDLIWWQMRVASASGTLELGGLCVKWTPCGKNLTKIEFFVKKIDFCLMPARNQNLQQRGGGGGVNQCPVGPNGHQN